MLENSSRLAHADGGDRINLRHLRLAAQQSDILTTAPQHHSQKEWSGRS